MNTVSSPIGHSRCVMLAISVSWSPPGKSVRPMLPANSTIEGRLQRVGDTIVDEARSAGCDLVVMGTHGRRGVSHALLGSDAERVARQCPVPVLLVRQG